MHNLSTLSEKGRKAALSGFGEMFENNGEAVPADLRESIVAEMMGDPDLAGRLANVTVGLACLATAGVSLEKLLADLFDAIVAKPHDNATIMTMTIVEAHLRAANPVVDHPVTSRL